VADSDEAQASVASCEVTLENAYNITLASTHRDELPATRWQPHNEE
jgi:hypothetical protein